MANFNIRVYLKTFDYDGEYDSDFTEITKYVQKIGDISIDTDSSDYQIGVFRTSNLKLVLNNREGLFGDVGTSETLFVFRRSNSIIRITYEYADDGPWCGVAEVNEEYLSEEVEIFRGLLNDDSFIQNAKDELVDFIVLGYESIFSTTQTPYSSLSNGDTVAAAIFTCLNQAEITDYLTIDLANINPGEDQAIDDVSFFENSTVKEALDQLLNDSNSILRIVDSVVYVSDRAPEASVSFHFYGQSSQDGVENVSDVSKISNGFNRTFNFIAWEESSLSVSDASSVAANGLKKLEISSDLFTDSAKRGNILNNILAEFSEPKREFELTTPFNYGSLDVELLDRVDINYPTILIPWENFPFPVCGTAICGDSDSVLPRGLWSLTISTDDNFKVIKKTMKLEKQEITFKMRQI